VVNGITGSGSSSGVLLSYSGRPRASPRKATTRARCADRITCSAVVVVMCDSVVMASHTGRGRMRDRAAYDVEVGQMSEQAAGEVFDGIARRELGISGSEFLQRWDAGEYQETDRDDVDGLSEVVAAMPLVR
jgi:hypothetical protein